MSFQKKCPTGTNKIMTMVESGLGTDEIAVALRDMAELKSLENVEGISKMEAFPDEIRLIAQALAFRGSETESDLDSFTDVITAAYSEEVNGVERFRQGEAMSKDYLKNLYEDKSYKWLAVEAPNGQGAEIDGAVLGVCCFSTDGMSRKNGEIEGRLGVIRLLCVLPRYQGLCIGNRLLKRTEKAMYLQGCVRSMVCVPSPRLSMSEWIVRRGYAKVSSIKYPTNIGHDLIEPNSIELLMYTRQLNFPSSSYNKNQGCCDYSDNCNHNDYNNNNKNEDNKNNGNNDNYNGYPYHSGERMFLPPHWRNKQPVHEEQHVHEERYDYDHLIDLCNNDDNNNNNNDNSNNDYNTYQNISNIHNDDDENDQLNKPHTDNNRDTDLTNLKNSNDTKHEKIKKITYVISENLTDDYQQPELD